MASRHPRRGGRTTPKGTRPLHAVARPTEIPELPPFVADARRALGERSPFSLLVMASGLIEATAVGPLASFGGRSSQSPEPLELFGSFVESGLPQLRALAVAAATIHGDPATARTLKALVGGDVTGGPVWLSTMGQIAITEVVVQRDPLDDGENIVIGWKWADGHEAVAVVYVDHNMGTLVKDGFVGPTTVTRLTELAARGPHIETMPMAAADARERITEAIWKFDHTVPPLETDSWPSCRPLIEWIVGHLPEGGTGYVVPEWSDADQSRLVEEFLSSTFAVLDGFNDVEVRSHLHPILWFGCGYGTGDPLRWSPVSVEVVLADWYPRKILGATVGEAERFLHVLASFIEFAHDRKGIPADLRAETIRAIARWRTTFLDEIAKPGRTRESNAVRLARIAAGFDDDEIDDDFEDDDDVAFEFGLDDELSLDPSLDDEEYMRRAVRMVELDCIELVGGHDAYEALDDAPLPDVAFDWSVVPAAVRDLTGETLDLLDRWAADLFDAEVRTIALPWAVVTRKDLAEATGVAATNIGSRSKTIANVMDRAPIAWHRVLHSTQRSEAIRLRTITRQWRDEHGDENR
jgi:hypothetical protein